MIDKRYIKLLCAWFVYRKINITVLISRTLNFRSLCIDLGWRGEGMPPFSMVAYAFCHIALGIVAELSICLLTP